MRWVGFILLLPFRLVGWTLHALYRLLYALLAFLGSGPMFIVGLVVVFFVGASMNWDGQSGSEAVMWLFLWFVVNRGAAFLARQLRPPRRPPAIVVPPKPPKRAPVLPASPVSVAVTLRAASPGEDEMRARLSPALQGIMG